MQKIKIKFFNSFYCIYSFTACAVLALSDLSLSCTIKCGYCTTSYPVKGVGLIYRRYIDNDPYITSKELAQRCDISGKHETSKNDYKVLGFYAPLKTIYYFPHALRNYQNFKSIEFQACKMKEIRQSDLSPFSFLAYLSLSSNDIEVGLPAKAH